MIESVKKFTLEFGMRRVVGILIELTPDSETELIQVLTRAWDLCESKGL